MAKAANDRHLSVDGFEARLRHGVPLDYPIAGDPRLILFIDHTRPAIGLRIPKRNGDVIPETGLAHVRVREVHADGGRRFEIAVTDRQLFLDAYPVLLAIADRIQIDGLGLARALRDTLRLLGRFLERRDSMPIEQELGLFGEILLLAALGATVGDHEAIEAWRGPEGEEHDYGLRGIDIEVKTTSSERRIHWISSLTQLVPIEDRPLWLISYQLTRAGPDGGCTLPELIDATQRRLVTGPNRVRLDERLSKAGWDESYEMTVRNRWRTRDTPIAFRVSDGFPRITPSLLDRVGIDLVRVSDVRYRIDLTDSAISAEVPGFLTAALAERERHE